MNIIQCHFFFYHRCWYPPQRFSVWFPVENIYLSFIFFTNYRKGFVSPRGVIYLFKLLCLNPLLINSLIVYNNETFISFKCENEVRPDKNTPAFLFFMYLNDLHEFLQMHLMFRVYQILYDLFEIS